MKKTTTVLIAMLLLTLSVLAAHADQEGNARWCNIDSHGCYLNEEGGIKSYMYFWTIESCKFFMGPDNPCKNVVPRYYSTDGRHPLEKAPEPVKPAPKHVVPTPEEIIEIIITTPALYELIFPNGISILNGALILTGDEIIDGEFSGLQVSSGSELFIPVYRMAEEMIRDLPGGEDISLTDYLQMEIFPEGGNENNAVFGGSNGLQSAILVENIDRDPEDVVFVGFVPAENVAVNSKSQANLTAEQLILMQQSEDSQDLILATSAIINSLIEEGEDSEVMKSINNEIQNRNQSNDPANDNGNSGQNDDQGSSDGQDNGSSGQSDGSPSWTALIIKEKSPLDIGEWVYTTNQQPTNVGIGNPKITINKGSTLHTGSNTSNNTGNDSSNNNENNSGDNSGGQSRQIGGFYIGINVGMSFGKTKMEVKKQGSNENAEIISIGDSYSAGISGTAVFLPGNPPEDVSYTADNSASNEVRLTKENAIGNLDQLPEGSKVDYNFQVSPIFVNSWTVNTGTRGTVFIVSSSNNG